jgi:hypothetical protein
VAIRKLLGMFECRFVVRAADFGAAFNVAVFTQRVDPIIGHGANPVAPHMPPATIP